MSSSMKIHKTHGKHRIKSAGYGTTDIAAMCSVTAATVAKWIDDGKIAAHVTVGGHRRVNGPDLVAFLRQASVPVPEELERVHVTHVLIVDDDPEDRALISRLIHKNFQGYTVIEAENGFEMGHKLASFRPAVVLLDLMMPGIDGFSVCEMIRKDSNLDKTKIVAISGRDDRAVRERILGLGADAFVSKNVDEEILLKELNLFLTPRRTYAPRAAQTAH